MHGRLAFTQVRIRGPALARRSGFMSRRETRTSLAARTILRSCDRTLQARSAAGSVGDPLTDAGPAGGWEDRNRHRICVPLPSPSVTSSGGSQPISSALVRASLAARLGFKAADCAWAPQGPRGPGARHGLCASDLWGDDSDRRAGLSGYGGSLTQRVTSARRWLISDT